MPEGARRIIDRLSLRRSLVLISLGLSAAAMIAIVCALSAITRSFDDKYYAKYTASWIRQSDAYFRSILSEDEKVIQDIFLAMVARKDILGGRATTAGELDSVMNDSFFRMEYVDDVYIVDLGASFAYKYSGKTLSGAMLEDPRRIYAILNPAVPSGRPYRVSADALGGRAEADRYVYKRPLILGGGAVGGYVILALSDAIFDDYFARTAREGSSIEVTPRIGTGARPEGFIGSLGTFPADLVMEGARAGTKAWPWKLAIAAAACLAISLAASLFLAEPTLAPLTAVLAHAENQAFIESQRGRISLSPMLASILRYFGMGALAPMLLFSLAAVRLEYDAQWDRVAAYSMESLEGEQVALDNSLRKFRELSSQIIYGEGLQEVFASERTQAEAKRADLERMTAALPYLRLYDKRGQVFFSSIASERQNLFAIPNVYDRVVQSKKFGMRYIGRQESYFQEDVLVFAQKVYSLRLPGKFLGYASVFLPKERLDSELAGIYPSETSDVFMLDEFGGSTPLKAASAAPLASIPSAPPSGRAIVSSRGERALAIETAASEFGFRLKAVVPLTEFEEALTPLSYSSAIILIAAFLAIAAIAFFLAYEITLPIQRLLGKLAAGPGDEIMGARYSGRNEIVLLHSRIDEIIERNRSLMEENTKARMREKELTILEKEAHLNALQQQVNPHFLYNTLETIKWTAYKRGQSDIVRMVTALSNYFRRTITNKPEPTTVADELALLGEYMYIQKVRYGERFAFGVEAEEAARRCAIPKFIIQPLIENAINHGMAGLETGGMISLTIRLEEGRLSLAVSDNGSGMDRETLERVNAGLASSGKSIGLANVYKRLQLLYGNRCTFAIESGPSAGTKISLSFPAEVVPEQNGLAEPR